MTGPERVPKGIDCACGKHAPFGPYVYAHWRETLLFTCDGCGKRYLVLNGLARPERKRRKPK